jgi:hypothetical protein
MSNKVIKKGSKKGSNKAGWIVMASLLGLNAYIWPTLYYEMKEAKELNRNSSSMNQEVSAETTKGEVDRFTKVDGSRPNSSTQNSTQKVGNTKTTGTVSIQKKSNKVTQVHVERKKQTTPTVSEHPVKTNPNKQDAKVTVTSKPNNTSVTAQKDQTSSISEVVKMTENKSDKRPLSTTSTSSPVKTNNNNSGNKEGQASEINNKEDSEGTRHDQIINITDSWESDWETRN